MANVHERILEVVLSEDAGDYTVEELNYYRDRHKLEAGEAHELTITPGDAGGTTEAAMGEFPPPPTHIRIRVLE